MTSDVDGKASEGARLPPGTLESRLGPTLSATDRPEDDSPGYGGA